MEQTQWSGSDEVPGNERRVFGDYVLLESLGRGSVGETFAARALKGQHQGDKVCLKLLHRQFLSPDQMGRLYRQAAVESLRHEARVVEQLTHPNIAQVLDFGAYNDVWFVAFGCSRAQIQSPCGISS